MMAVLGGFLLGLAVWVAVEYPLVGLGLVVALMCLDKFDKRGRG